MSKLSQFVLAMNCVDKFYFYWTERGLENMKNVRLSYIFRLFCVTLFLLAFVGIPRVFNILVAQSCHTQVTTTTTQKSTQISRPSITWIHSLLLIGRVHGDLIKPFEHLQHSEHFTSQCWWKTEDISTVKRIPNNGKWWEIRRFCTQTTFRECSTFISHPILILWNFSKIFTWTFSSISDVRMNINLTWTVALGKFSSSSDKIYVRIAWKRFFLIQEREEMLLAFDVAHLSPPLRLYEYSNRGFLGFENFLYFFYIFLNFIAIHPEKFFM